MDYQILTTAEADGILTVTLNRPKRTPSLGFLRRWMTLLPGSVEERT